MHPLRPPDLPKMVGRQMLLGIDKHVLFGPAAIAVVGPVVCVLPLTLTCKQMPPVVAQICMQIVCVSLSLSLCAIAIIGII